MTLLIMFFYSINNRKPINDQKNQPINRQKLVSIFLTLQIPYKQENHN